MNVKKINSFLFSKKGTNEKEINNKLYHVKNREAIKKYKIDGHEILKFRYIKKGYRFDIATISLRKGETTDRKEYKHMITLSKPSVEVLCVREEDKQLQICMIIQPRTPYQAEADGKKYARFFWEQPGGLVEEGQTFEEAALREVREETGYVVKSLQRLISPKIYRHVSYTDEATVLFLAELGKFKGQKLDENEDIKLNWYPVDEVEREFEDYMEGIKKKFFNFDLTEMAIIGLQRFFVKYHRGELSF